jgi:ubiquinone biosynthesis protein UbiJ
MSTLDYVLQAPWKRFINRVLGDYPRALERLQRHAMKTVALNCGPFHLRLTILADGGVDVAAQGAPNDAALTLAPHLLPALMANEEEALSQLQLEGEPELAQEVVYLLRNLEWDVEEDLSKLVGDIAAHRAVGAARAVRDWGMDAKARLRENFREYFNEERRL